MAVKRVYLSEAGAAAEAYAKVNNIALNFARFGIGDGENATPENCEVKNERYTLPIQMIKDLGDGVYKIRGSFDNSGLTEDFEYRELALYITDPKNTDNEILYCYGNAKTAEGDYTETIPAFTSSGNKISRLFDIDVRVSGGSATFTIDDTAKADIATTAELREDLTAEAETRAAADSALDNKIDTEASTRASAVEALQNAIEMEIETRANQDNSLNFRITAEAAARQDGDSAITDRIDGLGITASAYGGKANTAGTADTAKACTGNASTATSATKLATARTINIQDASATNTGTGASFDGSGNVTIKLPATIKAAITGNASTATSATSATSATKITTAGSNGWTTATDTVANWNAKGTCVWWFGTSGQLNGQVSTYGLLLNFANSGDVHQIWLPQTSGSMYHRSGNSSTGFTNWIRVVDSDSIKGFIPSGGAIGNILGYNSSGTAKWTSRHDFVYTCSTAAGTKAKTISVTGFNLQVGTCVRVLFTNGNSIANPTLNVGGSGAKEIVVIDGGTVKALASLYGAETTGAYKWNNNTVLDLYYNGSYWVVIENPVIYTHATTNQMTSDCDTDKQYVRVHINGYKKCWGYYEGKSNTVTLTFICGFSAAYSYGISVISDFTNSTGTSSNYATIQSKTKTYAKIKNGTYENSWVAQGY